MKKQGFSLVELMISLIVISIITAAFAPVVTKKLKASGAAYIASGGSASTICTNMSSGGGAYCKLCTKNTADGICLLCERTCPLGQVLDYDGCTCVNCNTGCKVCGLSTNGITNSTTCHVCEDGYYLNNGTCIACSSNCEKCTSSTQCSRCEKGYDIDPKTGSCVETCGDKDLLRIKSGSVDICVTKYNMGDKRKFPIPDTVKMIRAGDSTQAYLGKDVPACWYGITADKDKCNSSNGHYSGCGRTVCNWYAAREICSKFSLNGVAWRLPTLAEARAFAGYSENLKEKGLGLCNQYNYTHSAYCAYAPKLCYGSVYDYTCYPGHLWTDVQKSNDYAYYVLISASWATTSYDGYYTPKYNPLSVRCVQGGYPDISKQCTINDYQCEKCSSDGTTCTKCNAGYALESDNLCWMTCPSGQYARIRDGYPTTRLQECVDCPDPNCAVCNRDTTSCTTCKSGYILQNGTCKINCGTNMYFDTSTNACKYCPSGHHYCDGINLDPCKNAQGLYVTANKALCTSCPTGSCQTCKNGFLIQYKTSTYCNDCPDNCLTCTEGASGTGIGRCTVCDTDYAIAADGSCVKTCTRYDGDATNACLSCSSDYEKGCLSCKSGYGLAQMDGLINKGHNWRVCKKCPDHCTGCETSGFYDNSISACTQCESGYKLIGGSGNATCVLNTPVSCPSGCSECTSSETCTKCMDGYSLRSGACVWL